jgi:hypothetical protein
MGRDATIIRPTLLNLPSYCGACMPLDNLKLLRSIMLDDNLTAIAKHVAFVIALHRNEDTLTCCPSRERIAKLSSLSIPSVRRHLAELKQAKVIASITVMPIESGRDRKYNQYYFAHDFQECEKIAKTSPNGHREHVPLARIKLFGNDNRVGSL